MSYWLQNGVVFIRSYGARKVIMASRIEAVTGNWGKTARTGQWEREHKVTVYLSGGSWVGVGDLNYAQADGLFKFLMRVLRGEQGEQEGECDAD